MFAQQIAGRMANLLLAAVVFSTPLLVAGCASQGPLVDAIERNAKHDAGQQSNYHLIDISDPVVAILSVRKVVSLKGSFGQKPPVPRQEIAIGDVLAVSLFESSSGGLFFGGDTAVANGARQISLPEQTVGENGRITIPYAGAIMAKGRTPTELASAIEASFDGRAIEPQAIVSVVGSTGNSAVVMGEVSKSGRVNLSLGGEKILAVLASAGITANEGETMIRLVRRGKVQTVPLLAIVNNPAENIYVFPGDTIFVLAEPQLFNVMGSVNKPGQYPVGATSQTIAGSLSLAGGLSDSSADAGGVFIFRFEDPEVARKLVGEGVELRRTPSGVPIVYRIYFSDPNSFFWLQQIAVRNSDMIYVSNAVAREFQKFVDIFTLVVGLGSRL